MTYLTYSNKHFNIYKLFESNIYVWTLEHFTMSYYINLNHMFERNKLILQRE